MTRFTPPPRPALSPLDQLLQAYDLAIAACRARDARASYRHLAVLRAAHPCDTPSALGIDALYAWCERAVSGGDFLGAARTLEQLRGAWQAADRITGVTAPVRSVDDDRQPGDERGATPAIGA
jgi:hypothetical protein